MARRASGAAAGPKVATTLLVHTDGEPVELPPGQRSDIALVRNLGSQYAEVSSEGFKLSPAGPGTTFYTNYGDSGWVRSALLHG